MAKKPTTKVTVETINHDADKRKNIPTAEHLSVMGQEERGLKQVRYPRNTDLDPQLVWMGKDDQDWTDLVVNAPPLYIQEKVHPKALIDDLLRQTKEDEHDAGFATADLFADFDGIPKDLDKTDFYTHEQNWSNRMILGDSLQVMASLAEREGLRGTVQCIFFDPPYGIKFNSNFQWSTTDKAGTTSDSKEKISREPEQVKAFRDTWKYGIHSYLAYLRDRLTVARDLLTESGSIFVQIGDENVHRVRLLLEEVFGEDNFISSINFRKKTMPLGASFLEQMSDHILWFGKNREKTKSRSLYRYYDVAGLQDWKWAETTSLKRLLLSEIDNVELKKSRVYRLKHPSPIGNSESKKFPLNFEGRTYSAPGNGWGMDEQKIETMRRSGRLQAKGNVVNYIIFHDDSPYSKLTNPWTDTSGPQDKSYVVQTADEVVKRCILMSTDPGDLVLDPTCGSGTSAFVSEQWGRRWITIDTSRVALTLARVRLMGARYPYYLLRDSKEGQEKEAEYTSTAVSTKPVFGDIKHGFIYERFPHITIKSVANNEEINVIWDEYAPKIEEKLNLLNKQLNKKLMEWEVPAEADEAWPRDAIQTHGEWRKIFVERRLRIDRSIISKADFEFLYDKPFENKKKVRVAGPFTVESLSPHRVLGVDENDNLIDAVRNDNEAPKQSFAQMILDNLKTSGVQQAHKSNKIDFVTLSPWPGTLICAEGCYFEGEAISGTEKRAAIFIGPEFGTVQRADLVEAAREAGDAGFDVLIACAFNYEAHATDLNKLGTILILKARMNADLHMSEDLKNTGKGNLFVIFGEPDIDVINMDGDKIRVKVNGVDVFKPQTGEVVSDGADGIACWLIDTDYNEESFFVRHAYFLGANDPYSSLKSSLKAEINVDAWATLNSDISRPFPKPKSGRIAVKVINHLGDEVMKVFKV